MTTTAPAPDLIARADQLRALASEPGAEVYLDPELIDVEAWNLVGDPLCEALLGHMREHRLMGGGRPLRHRRRLEAERRGELMAYVAERIVPHKRIRLVDFIEAVPKSASGKILRKDLRSR